MLNKLKKKECFLSVVLMGVLVFGLSGSQVKKKGAEMFKIKPDLVVARVVTERIAVNSDLSHKVRITAVLANISRGSSCAEGFHVSLGKASPGGAFSLVNSQLVARLCSTPASSSPASITVDFVDTVGAGETRVWRVTVDSRSQVEEGSEGNNFRDSVSYLAKTTCSGVDLILTRVEFTRNLNDGGVIFRGFGKNRCSGTCPREIMITLGIPEKPEMGELGHSAGSGAIPFAECDSEYFGTWGSRDHDVTYQIGIRFNPPGPCVDVQPGNNTRLVTMRASENHKVVIFSD